MAQDLTQVHLGDLVGMGDSSIGTIERGDAGCNPTTRNLLLFAHALGVRSIGDLFAPLGSARYSEVLWHIDAPERERRIAERTQERHARQQ